MRHNEYLPLHIAIFKTKYNICIANLSSLIILQYVSDYTLQKKNQTHHQEASTSDVNQKIVTHTEKHIPLGNKFILQMFDR